MKPWKIIQKLESDNSRLFKEAVISDQLKKPHTVGLEEGLLLALDPLITFGVKKIPKSEKDGLGLTWVQFKYLARRLINRTATGHEARDLIEFNMSLATKEEWNDWYRRILIKDLKCGVSAKTVNNCCKKFEIGFKIPVFGCMLAHDGAKHPKKLVGECLVEYKYDGIRVITIVKDGTATMYSRNGKVLENFPHITKAINELKLADCMIDAEVMSEDFQSLMKQVHRKSEAKTEDAFLAVFDALPLEEFMAGKGKLNTVERKRYLKAFEGETHIEVVDFVKIDLDTEEGQTKFKEMNKTALDAGYEGLMVKPVEGLYENKRSHSWLKVKPFIEVTLEVIDTEEGSGKAKGSLGALVVEGTDDGKFFHLNVGSGLTDKDREDFWRVKKDLIGQLVEIRADAITQSQDEEFFSLRFPRFKTFRGFEVGEKL